MVFAPSRMGSTLTSATSTEIFAPARHVLILISVSAVNESFLKADCADVQRGRIVFRSEVKRGGGEVPVQFKVVRCETRVGNAPASFGSRLANGRLVSDHQPRSSTWTSPWEKRRPFARGENFISDVERDAKTLIAQKKTC